MGAGDWFNENIMGNPSAGELANLPQVNQINPDNYQIAGLQDYLTNMKGLQGSVPSADFSTATGDRANQSQLMDMLMARAQGRGGPSPAELQMQQAQQRAGAQAQGMALANQAGSNPALGLRNIMNANANTQGQIAGQGGILRAQEQMGNQQLAAQYSNTLRQQDMSQANMDFLSKMRSNQAQADLNQGIFNANRTSTDYRVEGAKNAQAYEMYKRGIAEQQLQNQAKSRSALWQGLIKGGLTVGGAALGSAIGPEGTALGGIVGAQVGNQVGNSFFGGGGGGGGGYNPAMYAAMMQQGGGGSGGVTPQDANYANQMATQGYVGQYGNTPNMDYSGATGAAPLQGGMQPNSMDDSF